MKTYLDRFNGAALSDHAKACLVSKISSEDLKANSQALLQALAGLEPLTSEQEDALIRQIDNGEIDLDMRICARPRRAIGDDAHISGDSQFGTVLRLLLPFAHQGERVMRHILYHHLPVDEPSVMECWHEHGLKLEGALFDSFEIGNRGSVIRPAEDLAEPPSSMVWDLLCNDPRRDLSEPHRGLGLSAADRLTSAGIFSSGSFNNVGPTVQHERMEKLLNRYPHFTSPECAKHFAECASFDHIWPSNHDGSLHRPPDMSASAAFYPETIYDIKPYHMECWQACGALDRILADPIWQGKEDLLESLLFSMHSSFQETPTQTILTNLCKVEATIARDYPMRKWSAAVA